MENILNNLNTFLSDLNVFYRKLQNYHWNVKGKDFFVVHPKLEEYYTEINEQIDEMAEHILALGGQPLGTLKNYLDTTKITEAENKKVDSTHVLNELIKDYSMLLSDAKNIKKTLYHSYKANTTLEYKDGKVLVGLSDGMGSGEKADGSTCR